jgi:glycine cleavage system H protein
LTEADLCPPPGTYVAMEPQTWARPEPDGSVTVGITALGIVLSGEIYMCRPKPPGQVVAAGRSLAVVELAKAIVAVKSPVAGEVLEVNEALSARPELVHVDPYGRGWLARLRPTDWPGDSATLVHGDALPDALRRHAAQLKDDAHE